MLASSTVLINGGDAYFLLVTIELGCWEKDEGGVLQMTIKPHVGSDRITRQGSAMACVII